MRAKLGHTIFAALAASFLWALPAQAASRLTIRGAGFGHGVGMSQYGALGYAQHGWTYDRILAHYYSATALGRAPADRSVRVLMASTRTSTAFTGADRAGDRTLDPAKTYRVRRSGAEVELLSPRGHKLLTVPAPLEVHGAGDTLTLVGTGRLRGSLRFAPGRFIGLDAINVVGLEDYVRGVVARESGATWPAAALQAQAVAARTYAITTAVGREFDQYADTRSQVYGGMAAETPATDAAVTATAGQVVTYQGVPAVTYFFSTSGGRTENVENTSLGRSPQPWLRSVDDPYDDVSPKHRWTLRMTLGQAGNRLRGLVAGRFRGVKVLKRGASPRVVQAEILGTRGRTPVDGATLRARLGLYDTWAYFTTVGAHATPPPDSPPNQGPSNQSAGDPSGGTPPGAQAARMVRRRVIAGLAGRVAPARRGSLVRIELWLGRRWTAAGTVETDSAGVYRYAITWPGLYRARFAGEPSLPVRIRPR